MTSINIGPTLTIDGTVMKWKVQYETSNGIMHTVAVFEDKTDADFFMEHASAIFTDDNYFVEKL